MDKNDMSKLIKAIHDFQQGDQTAFDTIYQLSNRDIYYTIFRTVKDRDVSADILQETYLEVYRNLSSLRNSDAFMSWIYTISQHKIAYYFKKNPYECECDLDDEIIDNVQESYSDYLPEDSLLNSEVQHQVKRVIDELPLKYRETIIAFYYNQMSIKEIGMANGIPENTVKTYLMRGKAKIKNAVIQMEEKQGIKLRSIGLGVVLMQIFVDEQNSCPVPDLKTSISNFVSSNIDSVGNHISVGGDSIISNNKVLLAKQVFLGAKIGKVIGGIAASIIVVTGAITGALYVAKQTGSEQNEVESTMIMNSAIDENCELVNENEDMNISIDEGIIDAYNESEDYSNFKNIFLDYYQNILVAEHNELTMNVLYKQSYSDKLLSKLGSNELPIGSMSGIVAFDIQDYDYDGNYEALVIMQKVDDNQNIENDGILGIEILLQFYELIDMRIELSAEEKLAFPLGDEEHIHIAKKEYNRNLYIAVVQRNLNCVFFDGGETTLGIYGYKNDYSIMEYLSAERGEYTSDFVNEADVITIDAFSNTIDLFNKNSWDDTKAFANSDDVEYLYSLNGYLISNDYSLYLPSNVCFTRQEIMSMD